MSLVVKNDQSTVNTESRSSIEITTNSKGITTYKVKVYDDDAVAAANLAVKITEQLRKKFGIKSRLNFGGDN